ncbi:MAG: hypothetical protein U0271_09125 [Polyangiaceae bacterium]
MSLRVSGLTGVIAIVGVLGACGDDGSGGAGGSGASGATGGAGGGVGTGGSYPCSPKASCDAGHDCISLTDNDGATKFGLRMSQVTFQKPSAFAAGIVGGTLSGGALPKLASCNLPGTGTFSWLMQFDTAAHTLKTGGAKPVADPSAGYSFVDNETVGNVTVHPVVLDATPDASGAFATGVGVDLPLVLYLDDGATQPLLMPLSKLQFDDSTLSADKNCIGLYNSAGLSPGDSCQPTDVVSAFVPGGHVHAYITLENADTIEIAAVHQSLCVLLSGDATTYGDGQAPTMKCKRDANNVILFKGDWCSTTDMAGGCTDSTEVSADFAASAVEILN